MIFIENKDFINLFTQSDKYILSIYLQMWFL